MTNWISVQVQAQAERPAGRRGQQRQRAQSGRRGAQRGGPADRQADGEDNGERLHPLDRGGQEQRQESRPVHRE